MGKDHRRSLVPQEVSGPTSYSEQVAANCRPAAGHRGPSGLHRVVAPTSSSRFQQRPFRFLPKLGKPRGGSMHPFVMQPLWPDSQISWGKFWETRPTTQRGWAPSVAPRCPSVPSVRPAVPNAVPPLAGLYPTWQPCPELALTPPGAFPCALWSDCAPWLCILCF